MSGNKKNEKKYISDNRSNKAEGEDFLKLYEAFDVESLGVILDAQPNLIDKKDEKTGWTLLFRAVLNSNYAISEFLLERNADPNVQNLYGETPLHHAVENSNHKIINLLLEKGANPNLQQMDGETAMHIAAAKGDYKVLKLLNLYGGNARISTFEQGYTPMDYASERGDKKCIEVLEGILKKQRSSSFNLSSLVGEGFQTTKNSHSPINRIRNNIHMSDVVLGMAPINTSKNSRSPYHHRNISQNYPSFDKRSDYLLGFQPNFKTLSPNGERRKSCTNLDVINQNPYLITNSSGLSPHGEAKSPGSCYKYPKRLANLNKAKKYGYDSASLPTYLNYVNLINSHNSRKQVFSTQNEDSTRLGGNTLNSHSRNININMNSNMNMNSTKINPRDDTHDDEMMNTRITHTTHQNTFMKTSQADEVFNFPLKREDRLFTSHKINDNTPEDFEDYNKVLAVFMSSKNDIDENYVKQKVCTNISKAAEIFNFNLEEMNEFIMKTEDNNIPEEDSEEDSEVDSDTNEEERIMNNFVDNFVFDHVDDKLENNFENTHTKNIYQENLTGTFYSKNFTFKNSESKHNSYKNTKNFLLPLHQLNTVQGNMSNNCQMNTSNTSNVKYFSKTGRSMKDEFKHITLDTQNINDMTIYQKCPDTDKHLVSSETLDKMNINFEKIRRNGSGHVELEYNSTEAIREISSFLKSLDLERYTYLFIKNGFDDLSLVVEQMRSDMAITDDNLKEIGISVPGHRAKILLKLEEECNNFGFPLPPNVYHSIPDFLNVSNFDISTDPSVHSLYNWLANLKMEQFIQNFLQNGYQSLDLLLMQMQSKNMLTEKILDEEIGINKIGYRIRILNKLKDDSKLYMNKLKSKLKLTEKREINQESCRCVIF